MDELSNERLKELVCAICEQQDKMIKTQGMTREQNRAFAAKLEPLKTPIYFVWEKLGYGDFPQSRTQRIWLSSFRTSPPDFLSECIMQIKSGEIPVYDRDLSRSLINFYSELTEAYEQ